VPGADPSPPSCPFCALFADRSLAPRDLTRLSDPTGDPARPVVWGFTPLSPVTPGHRLVVPERHVRDAAEDPHLTARVFEVAAVLLQELQHPANLVTSLGTVATQTVFHLHVHVVPRSSYDELCLPWDCQRERARSSSVPLTGLATPRDPRTDDWSGLLER
jgi:histidine triad (HIT) family protein